MEEDIKNSFNRIETIMNNEVCEFNKTIIEGNLNVIKRYIENLIKEYKELEEEDLKIRATFILSLKDYIPKSKVKELAKKYEFALNDYDSSTADYKHSQKIGKYMACIELLKEGE